MRRRNEEEQQKIRETHRMIYACGALTFSLATLITLPIMEKEEAMSLYLFLVKVYAILMVGAELLGLKIYGREKWNKSLAFVGILGAIFYYFSATLYEVEFNKGELYIAATFFTSLASELRILRATITQKTPIQRLLRQQSQKFKKQGLFAIGHILFLLGTILFLLQNNQQTPMKAGLLNAFGGAIIGASVFIMFGKEYRQNERKGYRKYTHEMVVPEIV